MFFTLRVLLKSSAATVGRFLVLFIFCLGFVFAAEGGDAPFVVVEKFKGANSHFSDAPMEDLVYSLIRQNKKIIFPDTSDLSMNELVNHAYKELLQANTVFETGIHPSSWLVLYDYFKNRKVFPSSSGYVSSKMLSKRSKSFFPPVKVVNLTREQFSTWIYELYAANVSQLLQSPIDKSNHSHIRFLLWLDIVSGSNTVFYNSKFENQDRDYELSVPIDLLIDWEKSNFVQQGKMSSLDVLDLCFQCQKNKNFSLKSGYIDRELKYDGSLKEVKKLKTFLKKKKLQLETLADLKRTLKIVHTYILQNVSYNREELLSLQSEKNFGVSVLNHWQLPKETLGLEGDCEDFAILLQSILEYLGVENSYIVVGELVDDKGKMYDHAWVEIDLKKYVTFESKILRVDFPQVASGTYLPEIKTNSEGSYLHESL